MTPCFVLINKNLTRSTQVLTPKLKNGNNFFKNRIKQMILSAWRSGGEDRTECGWNIANIKYLLKNLANKSWITNCTWSGNIHHFLQIPSLLLILQTSGNTNLLFYSMHGRNGMLEWEDFFLFSATGHLQDRTSLFVSMPLSLPLPFCSVYLALGLDGWLLGCCGGFFFVIWGFL